MEFYNSAFSACGDARGYGPEKYRRISSICTRPRPAGVSGILQFLILRVRDARGYTPVNHRRISSIRTRPRLAGVNGILQFLFSACEDARGYISRDQLMFLRFRSAAERRNPLLEASPRRTHPTGPILQGKAKGCRVERSAPCCRVRPLGLRLPSKRTSPFFGGYPSSNRTCRFPAYGSPCGTGFISFAPLRLSAPFHIDSNGCSSIWTSGFRRAAT